MYQGKVIPAIDLEAIEEWQMAPLNTACFKSGSFQITSTTDYEDVLDFHDLKTLPATF